MPNSFDIPLPFTDQSITIHLYGIIIMLGVLAAAFLAARIARRKGLDNELVWDGLIWLVIGGIVGARIWHILTPPPSMQVPPPEGPGLTTAHYLTHPLDAIAIWNGGLGIPGAVIGGALALYLFCRRRGLNFLVWADIAAPALALGQAIGRWGNFVNQEIYGRPTDLPWGIFIENPLEGYDAGYFHPLFLYESLWNFLNVILLIWLSWRYEDRLLPGDIVLTYLVVYPTGRFLLEFLRLDSSQIAGINANQTLMLVVALAAAVTIFVRHRRNSVVNAEES